MDYKQEIKERLEMLPEALATFIKEEIWRKEAQKIGQQFGFDDSKYISFENEIFLVLLCFEPRNDLKENLKSELGTDNGTSEQLVKNVNDIIFSKVANELSNVEKEIEENEKKEQPQQSQNGVGQSFEQIILNQARAMQPARPKDETSGIVNKEYGIKEEKPVNLPTGPQAQPQPSVQVPNYSTGEHKVHDYKPGADPYREPIE